MKISLPQDQMIYVLGHNYSYMDLDALISSQVLAELLSAQGYKAQAVCIEPDRVRASTLELMGEIGGFGIPLSVTKVDLEVACLILVDHNDPNESYGRLGIMKPPWVILDHHVDSGTQAVIEKRIENTGSTCTLLVELCQNEGWQLSDRQARALAFTIISDTRGLKGRKTTERDILAVNLLYREHEIGISIEAIRGIVLGKVSLRSKSVQEILYQSLKEYRGGTIAIAAVETGDDEYLERLEKIREEGKLMPYELYILMIIKHHRQETDILYFDHRYNLFPTQETRLGLVSRGKDLAPEILERCIGARP